VQLKVGRNPTQIRGGGHSSLRLATTYFSELHLQQVLESIEVEEVDPSIHRSILDYEANWTGGV